MAQDTRAQAGSEMRATTLQSESIRDRNRSVPEGTVWEACLLRGTIHCSTNGKQVMVNVFSEEDFDAGAVFHQMHAALDLRSTIGGGNMCYVIGEGTPSKPSIYFESPVEHDAAIKTLFSSDVHGEFQGRVILKKLALKQIVNTKSTGEKRTANEAQIDQSAVEEDLAPDGIDDAGM